MRPFIWFLFHVCFFFFLCMSVSGHNHKTDGTNRWQIGLFRGSSLYCPRLKGNLISAFVLLNIAPLLLVLPKWPLWAGSRLCHRLENNLCSAEAQLIQFWWVTYNWHMCMPTKFTPKVQLSLFTCVYMSVFTWVHNSGLLGDGITETMPTESQW